MDDGASSSCPTFEAKKHTAFWLRHLRLLPRPYVNADTQRVTIAFFCLSALDLLGALATGPAEQTPKVGPDEQQAYREWLWSLQLDESLGGGFVGSPAVPTVRHGSATKTNPLPRQGHLAMTYAALLSLAILRDDFSRLDGCGVRTLLRNTQQSDGSFSALQGSTESDPRFVYCAFAICWMLDDWDSIDVDLALRFLDSCESFDGAFGQGPAQESHGGSTYCAVSAYSLAGQLEQRFPSKRRSRLVSWLLARQSESTECTGYGGFNGRIGKFKDSCYSFWCGASLAVLSSHHLIDARANTAHLLRLQTVVGGIAKTEDDHPDAMHSYLSLAALSIHTYAHSRDDDDSYGWLCPSSLRTGIHDALDPRINLSHASTRHLLQTLRALWTVAKYSRRDDCFVPTGV